MSAISFVGCLIGRHQPFRRDVEWNGLAYVGTCRHCAAAIIRHNHNDWRKRGKNA